MSEDLTYIIRRDGNIWIATRSDFVDRAYLDYKGMGDTPSEALADLMELFESLPR